MTFEIAEFEPRNLLPPPFEEVEKDNLPQVTERVGTVVTENLVTTEKVSSSDPNTLPPSKTKRSGFVPPEKKGSGGGGWWYSSCIKHGRTRLACCYDGHCKSWAL